MFVVFVHISKRPTSHVSTMFEYLRNTNIILWSKKFKKFSCKSIPVGITAHYLCQMKNKSFEHDKLNEIDNRYKVSVMFFMNLLILVRISTVGCWVTLGIATLPVF